MSQNAISAENVVDPTKMSDMWGKGVVCEYRNVSTMGEVGEGAISEGREYVPWGPNGVLTLNR